MLLLQGYIFIGQPNFKCFGQKQCFLQLLPSLCRTERTCCGNNTLCRCVHPWSQECQRGGHHTPCSRRAKQPPRNPNQSVKAWTDFNLLWILKRSLIISINEKAESNLELIWLVLFPQLCFANYWQISLKTIHFLQLSTVTPYICSLDQLGKKKPHPRSSVFIPVLLFYFSFTFICSWRSLIKFSLRMEL